jgi:hypothetical protein
MSTLHSQVKAITGPRHKELIALRREIITFFGNVKKEEQPFQKVRDLVEATRRRQNPNLPEFDFDQSILQTHGQLLAHALILRLDAILFFDQIKLWDNLTTQQRSRFSINIDASSSRTQSIALIDAAIASTHLLQEAEGHIFWALFAVHVLDCTAMTYMDGDQDRDSKLEMLKREATLHLDQAEVLCQRFPAQTQTVAAEVDGVRRLLDTSIADSDMRMIVAAMEREFHSQGHGYRCVNGHPFTIGEFWTSDNCKDA